MENIRITPTVADISVQNLGGLAELKNALLGVSRQLIIPSEAEHCHLFWLVEWGRQGYEKPLQFGVRSQGHGIVPELLERTNPLQLFAGIDSTIVGLDVYGDLVFEHPLPGVFYKFLIDHADDVVMAVHELGLVALRTDGSTRWRYDTSDILSTADLRANVVDVTDINGITAAIDLRTGTNRM